MQEYAIDKSEKGAPVPVKCAKDPKPLSVYRDPLPLPSVSWQPFIPGDDGEPFPEGYCKDPVGPYELVYA